MIHDMKNVEYCTCGIACATRIPRVSWIEIDSMPYRFRMMWSKSAAHTDLDMGKPWCRRSTTKHSTHGNDAKGRKMPQAKILQEFRTDAWEAHGIENHKKLTDGTKHNVQHTIHWRKKITRTRSRGSNICAIHQNGPSSLIARDPTDRWLQDPAIEQQFNWKSFTP